MRHEEIDELQLHRLALDQSPDSVVVIDGTGRLLHANQAARDVHGASSRMLRNGITDGGELAGFLTALRASGRASAEKRLLDGDGRWRQLLLKGTCIAPDRYAVFTRDVTERRDVEAELQQLRRVESLGYLTASVVHDFNNLLTPIVCLSAVLTHELEKGSRASEMAKELRETAERAAGLARQMLSLARRAPEQPRRLDVGAVVSGMKDLLRRVVGDEIEVVLAIDEDSGDVTANREQLEQVLLNLAANARDAMPRGGRLVIATSPVTLVGEGDPESAQAGAYVALRVSDTGVGMTAEVRERVFERFFTTKAHEGGTGLGLAAAHRFARTSGGCISVRSTEGAGTTVTLCLPRLDGLAMSAPPSSHELLPRGSETVLVVEDDASVRGVVRELLEAQGYRVLDAPTGKAALEIAARKPGPIDLLVVDVVMPEMGGRAIADALCAMGLSMKVLFISGHPDAMVLERGVNPTSSMFLRKAFSPAELILKVREVLGEERRRVELKLA